MSFFAYDAENVLTYQSTGFVVLFFVFYAVYISAHRAVPIRNILLLIFSLFFYYKLSGWYVGLLVLLTSSDFLIGLGMRKYARFARYGVWLSVLLNISFLAYYKYTYFLIDIYNGLSGGAFSLAFAIIQPIGISYYVFKSLSYVIDLDREVIEEPERNYVNYLLFVSFFPNILAGPISKARDLLPQFHQVIQLNRDHITKGVFLLLSGLFKKILIADYIAANMTARVFEAPDFFSAMDKLMACFGGLTQLYFDFSGYTDLMLGFAMFLGFTIEPNFNQPFKATNISGFWKRWHMSFYNWLSEYVFQPIAYGLRRYQWKGTIIAIYATFIISGIWHGPNYTFVFWAIIHGSAIAMESLTTNVRSQLHKRWGSAYLHISTVFTFLLLVFSGVLLHCDSIGDAAKMLSDVFTQFDSKFILPWLEIYHRPFLVMVFALMLQFLPLKFYQSVYTQWNRLPVWAMSICFCFAVLLFYQFASMESLPFKYIEF
ncbi:MAG: MBOAT family O-acyltransferase [Flavobacteriales bacterium]